MNDKYSFLKTTVNQIITKTVGCAYYKNYWQCFSVCT